MPTTVSYLTTDLRSDLGPLTTTFTPPSDCTSLQFVADGLLGLNVAASALCYTKPPPNGVNPQSTSVIKSCYPEGYASFYNSYWNNYFDHVGVYSPASICPSGYTVACAQARSKGQANPFRDIMSADAARTIWDLLHDGESALGCCPINYNCHSVTSSLCEWAPFRRIEVTDAVKCPGTLTPFTNPTTAGFALAMRVVVVQAATPEHVATPTASSAPTSSIPSPSTPASSVPSENSLSKSSQGLPLAAKIAIGVLIPLAAILSGAVCFFIYRYRVKRKLLQAPGLDEDARNNGGRDLETPKPELPGDDGIASSGPNGTAFRKAELDTTMSGSGGAVELAAELACGGLSELHGSSSSPGELNSMPKGLSVIDTVEQNVDNQHVDERSKGLWQWSSYWD